VNQACIASTKGRDCSWRARALFGGLTADICLDRVRRGDPAPVRPLHGLTLGDGGLRGGANVVKLPSRMRPTEGKFNRAIGPRDANEAGITIRLKQILEDFQMAGNTVVTAACRAHRPPTGGIPFLVNALAAPPANPDAQFRSRFEAFSSPKDRRQEPL
jgi:hypothetical protein